MDGRLASLKHPVNRGSRKQIIQLAVPQQADAMVVIVKTFVVIAKYRRYAEQQRGCGDAVGVNLDVAAALEIEIAPEILETADLVIGGGQFTMSPRLDAVDDNVLVQLAADDRLEADQAYLHSRRCTPDMIAEQQTELDAMDD